MVYSTARTRKSPHGRQSIPHHDLWLFGKRAVESALCNPMRIKKRLVVTLNAMHQLAHAIERSGIKPDVKTSDAFKALLGPEAVHQGAALHTVPLVWGHFPDVCLSASFDNSDTCAHVKHSAPLVVLLDRVTDPHNVGAILRTARAFSVSAVIAPVRHSAHESGAMAKAASGMLESQPYLHVPNLVRAINILQKHGYTVVGFDGTAEKTAHALFTSMYNNTPMALIFGAEGRGIRPLVKKQCDWIVRIDTASDFASLNVSNAVAITLYAVQLHRNKIANALCAD